ncbi:MAG: PAS domain-containing protein [Chitinophagaceae bacterium]|nr:PAS domain-containing protein [Chitinophagaceae bacterium]
MPHSLSLAWVIDEQTNLVSASESFFKHFNLNADSCIGRRVTSFIPPTFLRAVFQKHIQAAETRTAVSLTKQVQWVNGNSFDFQISIFPLSCPHSGKLLLAGQAVNVPDTSGLEKELRLAKERIVYLTRATSDAIWEWDMQTGQIFRNETLMEMIGYQWDNSKGLSWWLRRIHPEDRDRVGDKVRDATDNYRKSWEDEYRFKCADGTYKHVQDKGFVVYENGLPVKMIGTLQDISHLKQLQNELADERLQRQKEIAETVIRAQEKEKTRIGHELHDNVNQILLTAKLFIDKIQVCKKDQQEFKDKGFDYISLAIEEIRKLSKELVAPQLKEESLTGNIQSMIKDIQLAGGMNIQFRYNGEIEVLSPGKKITIFRIVQEQLKNILKHSQASLTQITLCNNDNGVRLVIQDNGNGFDPRQTYQGIGFSNIRERSEFYNGTVEVAAAPGDGCTLSVSFPCVS